MLRFTHLPELPRALTVLANVSPTGNRRSSRKLGERGLKKKHSHLPLLPHWPRCTRPHFLVPVQEVPRPLAATPKRTVAVPHVTSRWHVWPRRCAGVQDGIETSELGRTEGCVLKRPRSSFPIASFPKLCGTGAGILITGQVGIMGKSLLPNVSISSGPQQNSMTEPSWRWDRNRGRETWKQMEEEAKGGVKATERCFIVVSAMLIVFRYQASLILK